MVTGSEEASTTGRTFRPRPSDRRFYGILMSLFIAFLMIGSPLLFGSGTTFGSAAAPAPRAGVAVNDGFDPTAHVTGAYIPQETGAQLEQAPVVPNPTTSPQLSNDTILGATNPASEMYFTVGFAMSNTSVLTNILAEQAQIGSPMYRHWLTQAQENAMFAANPTVVQNTINYYTAEGFHVESRGPISVSFEGSAAQVESTFQTGLDEVVNGTGAPISTNTQTLSLPAPLAPFIATVGGLNSLADAQIDLEQPFSSDLQLNPALQGSEPSPATVPVAYGSNVAPGANAGAGPVQLGVQPSDTIYNDSNISDLYNYTNHAFGWIYYFSHTAQKYESIQVVTPASLAYLYDEYPLLKAGINGNASGTPQITIAVIAFGGINPSDFRTFSQEEFNNPNQLLDRLTALPVDGAFGLNGTLYYTDGDSGEMALDIEYSSTMAPAAHIIATYGEATSGFNDQLAALYALPTAPNVISISYGGLQDYDNLYAPNWDGANWITNNYFMLLDARGTTISSASGDGGGFDGTDRGNTGVLSGEFPSGSPYVLPVEGVRTVAAGPNGQPYPSGQNVTIGWTNVTLFEDFGLPLDNYQMRISTATQAINESYWYEPWSNYTLERAAPQGAGGFGISEWFQQGWWQHGINMPDIGRTLGSAVAAEADYNESIFFDGQWEYNYGGTSFACPTDAGMLGLIDDYLGTQGLSPYMGNGNAITAFVGNAWQNGNLSAPGLGSPYWNVHNGTSFWANEGELSGWTWPPGELFPYNGSTPIYGDTSPYWNFPTGWGIINTDNFAVDLAYLLKLPGNFETMNTGGTAYDPALWGNMTVGNSYTLQVNSTPAIDLLNPDVTVLFWNGTNVQTMLHPTLTLDSSGYLFTLDTAGFNSAGYLVFEFGDSLNATLGFAYTFIGAYIAPAGVLQVTVINTSSTFAGGDTNFNALLGSGSAPWNPNWLFLPYVNTFPVLVTYNGVPVYNAQVVVTIPSFTDVAFEGSLAENDTFYHIGKIGAYAYTDVVTSTFTNLTGIALVQTENMVRPTPYMISASYGGEVANTTFTVQPMPNAKPIDNYGGTYSQLSGPQDLLSYLRKPVTNLFESLYFPNYLNQSDYYNYMYAWRGEQLNVSVNNYAGAMLPNMPVWLGLPDVGHQTEFDSWAATYGDYGLTNISGTGAYTNASGDATIYVPQNISSPFDFGPFSQGPYAGSTADLELLGISIPGQQNETFNRSEPCSPDVGANYRGPATPLITCVYNNSFVRNYTTAPVVVFPDPVFAYTETTSGTRQDFFGTGSNISWEVNVSLPDSNPFSNPQQTGYNWDPALEHIVTIRAYVDGVYAGNLTPNGTAYAQSYNVFGNLTGVYSAGIHHMVAVVVDSLGHTFTYNHTFIVGAITLSNLGPSQVYTPLPYELDWSLNLPYYQVSNKTFNMSLAIRYVTNVFVDGSLEGCGGFGIASCPQLVNLSIPIHPQQVLFNQSLNRSLLEKNGFYSGGTDIPPGQYQILIWLTANHTGSISDEATTYFVFDPLTPSIDGPGPNAVVPLGNVTISYSYTGLYISNAQVQVYGANDATTPVFQTSAYTPGTGVESNSTTWTSVQPGSYDIVLSLTSPYQNNTTSEWINVSASHADIYHNGSKGQIPLFGLPITTTVTTLAIIGAVVGLLLAAFVAPTLLGGGPKGPDSDETKGPGSGTTSPDGSTMLTCPICQDTFESRSALDQHSAVIHGQSK